jgi:integrase
VSTAPAALRLASSADAIDRLYSADAWQAGELGVPARRGRDRVSFAGIEPAWLREALKRWARQRLASGCSFNTVTTAATAIRRFSFFLAECTPPVVAPEQITRPLIERYLAWVTARPLADASKNVARLFVRAFLNDNKRYGWVPAIPADAVIYLDELSSHKRPLPRFLPEFVMAQLESDASLARLAAPYRYLIVVMIETGLRAGDACTLPFDALITDSSGWPCLRVQVSKMRAEHLVPLSARAADAVRAQQAAVTGKHPGGTPWLFPARGNPRLPVAYNSLRGVFNAWQEHIGLHDEAGRPVHVTLHQLRHTFGTRLINSGVPQHVIQRLLCHASPEMTNFYAHLHDTTIRAEFERYCQTRVDIEGKLLGFDPDAATADAEWVKHRLSRAADALPNGYCGRPPQQDCPHPNACLTCPDFQTTAQFLPAHRQQAQQTRQLLAAAEAAGRERLAAGHRKVLINLNKIITSLEGLRRDAGNSGA